MKNFEESHEFEERLKKLSSDEPFFFLIKPANSILEVRIGEYLSYILVVRGLILS